MSRYFDRSPTRIIKPVEPSDPIGNTSQQEYEDDMRDGSRLLIWGIMALQAEREGPDAVRRFHIMQEFAHGNV